MKSKRFKRFSLLVLVIVSLFWLLPTYSLLTTSFKTQQEVSEQEYIKLPASPQISNYFTAFKALLKGLLNSIIVSFPATFFCILLGSFAGYYLSLFDFKYSQIIFFTIVVASFLPYQIVIIPINQLMSKLHLHNTYLGLILVYIILNLPMGTLIIATFFMKIPKTTMEAAIVDGCKPFAFYGRILVPMSLPGIIAATILVFVQIYNEFLLALVLTSGPDKKTVMPFLIELKGSQISQWHIQMAGAVITSIIPLFIFIVLSRYFVSGMMAGYSKE